VPLRPPDIFHKLSGNFKIAADPNPRADESEDRKQTLTVWQLEVELQVSIVLLIDQPKRY